MGGFFMLFRMILFRLGPVILLRVCKDRKSLKVAVVTLLLVYLIAGILSILYLWGKEQWKLLIIVPVAMFPQFLCYLFVAWVLLRCALSPWSSRVWRRIYRLSVLITLFGVYLEYTINPIFLKILQRF